jgi:hypothetical protein
MPIQSPYVFIASMDVDDAHDALFNEVYDSEHVPLLLRVPGVRSVTRLTAQPFDFSVGGGVQHIVPDGPRYAALYELDAAAVLTSPEWARAVDSGRWPTEVRPYTLNRRHMLLGLR